MNPATLFFSVILALAGTIGAIRGRNSTTRGTATAVALVFGLVAVGHGLRIVPAGHVGVIVFLGNVSERVLRNGPHLVNPLADVKMLSVRTEEFKESIEVLSKEGMSVQLDLSCFYHVAAESAWRLYRDVADFEGILTTQLRSVAREVTASYDAKALYNTDREALAQQISGKLGEAMGPRGVVIESTPMRKVGLPAKLKDAIEQKLKADQESQRMEFVLKREAQEAERKRIEARGIADFQDIVAKGISPNVLKWKGIEATQNLAESSNSKIVIVGGKDGLPLILNSN